MNIMEKKSTGYPSVDKPWLKYYSEEAINTPLPECTMYEFLWQNNKDFLDDVALRYYGTKITYRKLFENIQKAASAFYAMGVRPGNIVTIMSMHTPEAICAIYALNYIGAVANMVYMTLSDKEIVETVHNTDSKLLLVLDVAMDRVNKIADELEIPVVVLGVSDSMPLYLKLGYQLKNKAVKHSFLTWEMFLQKGTVEPPLAQNSTSPAIIVYTSGTTGEPKGVVLSNNNLNSVVEQLKRTDRNYRRKETVLMILPPFIIFGASMSHLGLSAGIEIILCIQLDNDVIGKMFNKHKPNRYVAGPMYLDGLIKHVKGNVSGLVDITGGGDAITPEQEKIINQFLKAHGSSTKYMTGYGMSEVSAAVTLNLSCANREGSLGIPLPKTVAKIVDPETQKELSYDEVGEICFATPGCMNGYFHNEKATAECIEVDPNGEKWLHTGDLGSIDKDGFLFFKGRHKRIFMILGADGFAYKLFPQRIEEYFESQEEVHACGVVVQEDPIHLHIAHAFISLSSLAFDSESIIKQLQEKASAELPEHLRPATIHILSSMPVTPSGKIDYRALEREAAKER